MSIAELIMKGTERASKSTDWVADSLAKIGDNVSKVLREREQQKQAQEMLPFLQQSMQESMSLAGSGKTGEAYAKLMPFLADTSVINNPNLLLPIQTALKLNEKAADDFLRKSQIEAYKARYGGGTGGGGGPSPDSPRYGFGNISSVDNETVTPLPVNFKQPLDEMPQTTGAGMPALTGGFSASLNDPIQEGTPAQQAGKQNVEEVLTLPPEQQKQATMSFGVTNFNPDQYEVRNIAGLSKYLPDFVGFAVPKETWKETTASLSGKGELSRQSKLTAPEARENFLKDGGTKANVEEAVRTMSDKTMDKLFNDFGKDIYALRAATDQKDSELGKKTIFTVTRNDGKDIKITEDQYKAIETIAGITPAVAENAGGTPAIFKPSSTTETPAQQDFMGEMATQYGPPPKSAKGTGAPPKSAKELTLEEQLAQEAASGGKTLARTATPEQLKGVEKSKISQKKSTLESEKIKLESLLYDVARATGRKTLKAGISANTKSKAEARIAEINKELEGL